jgi:CIC family chloride channel protein
VDGKRLPESLARFLPSGGLYALTRDIEFLSLWRWAKLSVAVGLVVGLAAVGVARALAWGEITFLSHLGGVGTLGVPAHWWILLVLPTAGGLAAGIITQRLAPETRGAGVNAVIDAYHNTPGNIRARVPGVKLVATLFTLGTGGSAGREGPMAHIGAGVGSYVGARFQLNARERRLLLLAGAAGGISALFRAPLGAALWSMEVLYQEDFESEGLFPSLVSSVTAYSVYTTINSPGSLFSVLSASGAPVRFTFHPAQLVFYGAVALACAPLAVLWMKMLSVSEKRIWRPAPLPGWAKPALGGLLLGGLCIGVPWVFGAGYGWMQEALRGIDDPARELPIGYAGFGLLLLIAVAKMLATSLTVTSGGSGGVFAPALFIGGFIGGAFGLLFHQLFPDIVGQPTAFVLVGMGAFYAGMARTPIATIILISELFGSYDLLVPLMFTEMITLLLLRRFTLYEKQVPTRRESAAHAAEFTVDVLQDLSVRDCYTEGRGAETVPADMTLSAFLEHVSSTADSFFIVRAPSGKLAGIVSLSNVRSIMGETNFLEAMVVSDAMWKLRSVAPDTDLRAALEMFLESGYDHLPVIDPEEPNEVMGMLAQAQIFSAYNAEIRRRRLTGEDVSEPA